MAIRVSINHRTDYHYDRPISVFPHVLRLRPAPHCRTPIQAYALRVSPDEHFINWQQDPFGNFLARLVFPTKTPRLGFEVDLVAEMTVINPLDFFLEEYSEKYPFQYPPDLRRDLAPYFEIKEAGEKLRRWLAEVDATPRATVSFLSDCNRRLQGDVDYIVRLEPGVQSCEQTLALGSGSCRDSAWLLVQCLRHLGLAARFASGYLVQLSPDLPPLEGPPGPTQDFTDLHAWAEVYVPGAGWIGLDPTSGLFAGEGHLPLACTPDPASAAPVSGSTEATEVRFSYTNRVQRIHEDPRVTRPYTERQWQQVLELGERVDEALHLADVRLTMGGEPTFVSVDDMDAPQWNTAALGAHKRERAEVLLRRLWRRFAPGGLLHHGQGKWYPGEPLPRWALSVLWRSDGVPLWNRAELLAEEMRDYALAMEDAARLTGALCERLGVDAAHAALAYEDVLYHLWKEHSLPENVDLHATDLRDPLERARLARLIEQGLSEPVGYVLPLGWVEEQGRWCSQPWRFRRGRLCLTPGDSAAGYRLPLDSLPWEPEARRQVLTERDPFEERYELSEPSIQRAPVSTPARGAAERAAAQTPGERAPEHLIRTALCVEPRGGRLYVFLPPLSHPEHFVDLVSRLEQAAAACATPVVLEGYLPPRDHRLRTLQVTPDPGVVEVNVHPAHSWAELVRNVGDLYEDARLSRLGTEKFMLDGRHAGTGGGNHVTLGGPTPADSPFLRRPDLLASLVLYWQHHPSLSYLFSGMFIGPTSQAPRVDEGRDESVHELEVALSRVPDASEQSPWVVDRLFRNLLVDLTGNTHRAEFCIDKLYSPDSASGRQGLLELRAFEMPPHARMSLVQMLLVRTLVARFWSRPYRHRPIRWGTALHDQFMLPYYVWEDIEEVTKDCAEAGFALDLAWFEPFYEFRFPVYGSVNVGSIELQLRFAIEPWHVLGEEAAGQGTARFVDSSLERVQITARGLTDSRHVIACNGRRLPLRRTGVKGEYVAGVRFKAWQPPSGLHPTIAVQSPLVFDVIDSWNSRSIGGCTYHVSHPGGRHYETLPVNASEAEARRISRFFPYGHTPGPIEVPREEPARDYPHTLDLRYPSAL